MFPKFQNGILICKFYFICLVPVWPEIFQRNSTRYFEFGPNYSPQPFQKSSQKPPTFIYVVIKKLKKIRLHVVLWIFGFVIFFLENSTIFFFKFWKPVHLHCPAKILPARYLLKTAPWAKFCLIWSHCLAQCPRAY